LAPQDLLDKREIVVKPVLMEFPDNMGRKVNPDDLVNLEREAYRVHRVLLVVAVGNPVLQD